MQHGIARDSRIVDQNFDGTERGLHLLYAGSAGLKRDDVPLEDGDAGFTLKFCRSFVVAGVTRPDLIVICLQRLTDSGPDTAGAASDQCNASHGPSLHRRPFERSPRLKLSTYLHEIPWIAPQGSCFSENRFHLYPKQVSK